MRSFLNVTKCENSLLSEKFSFLLKYNEDCTADDFSWAAITVFDHWLYETDSFKVIEEASCAGKQGWNNAIKLFLKKLVELEEPLKYKYIGRNSNQKLQFSYYIKNASMAEYVAKQFDEVYSPNLVFNRLGVDLWFEDNWTIHFKYKSQQGCLEMLKLASELGLFILPAYCADHLNNYEVLSDFMRKNGLDKSLHRDFVAAA